MDTKEDYATPFKRSVPLDRKLPEIFVERQQDHAFGLC